VETARDLTADALSGARREELLAELARLHGEVEKLSSERERFRTLYFEMLEKAKKLEHGLFAGQRSERLREANEAQLTLQLLAALLPEAQAPAAPPPSQPVRAHARKRPGTGRRDLAPAELPRVEIELVPDEVARAGTDAFTRIGEERSVVVERRPASLVAVHVVRPKFVAKDAAPDERSEMAPSSEAQTPCTEAAAPAPVRIAEALELPIPRGLAGPGLLADTIVRRFCDHLPLNRLESIYAREGLALARSTLCGWHEELCDLVRPLVDAMWEDALAAPVLHTDATGVLVQAKERCTRAHFFVVLAPGRHALFHFTRKHDKAAVDRMLAGYQGYLVADAHSVYDHLYADGTVVEVACWAHCRRYFFKALTSEPEPAREALALIGELFRREREARGFVPELRQHYRAEHSRPWVEAFFAWCRARAPSLLEGTPLHTAVRYALNHEPAFRRFLEDGRLPLHNNDSERQLRRQAVGRKNWIFVGSDHGAEANAAFTSLLASCQLHGLEPWAYLRDLLCLLPGWKRTRVLELAPAYFAETAVRPDVREQLEAHPLRAITLRPAN
jgi:transposase